MPKHGYDSFGLIGGYPTMRRLTGWIVALALGLTAGAQETPSVSVSEAVRLANQGKLQEAIEAFEALYQRAPDNKTVLNWLGYLYLKVGKPAEAVPVLEKAVQLTPNSAEAWNNLGNAYLHTGQLEKAIDAYKKTLALKPNSADAHYNICLLYTSDAADE